MLLKLIAARAVDRADAVELLRIHGDRIERDYLRTTAESFGLVDSLRDAMAEAEKPESPY